MERTILIHFDRTSGEWQIEAEGFEGLSCLQATQPFEEVLGMVEEGDRLYKSEAQVRHEIRTTQTHRQHLQQ